MKATFDIAAIALAIWIGLGKILIPLILPVPLFVQQPDVSLALSDASTAAANTDSELQSWAGVVKGHDHAITKLVSKDVHNDNRFSELENRVAKLETRLANVESDSKTQVWIPAQTPPVVAPSTVVTPVVADVQTPKTAYDAAVADAKSTERRVLFVLSRDNCGACEELAANVLNDQRFLSQIQDRFVLCKINKSQDPGSFTHFNVSVFPAALVYDPKTDHYDPIGVPTSVGGFSYIVPPKNVSAFLLLLK